MDSRIYQILQELSLLVRPPPKRAAWQWAEQHRKLPKEASEPGPYRANRTPWVIDITEAIASWRYNEVVCVMGGQLGKTDGIGLNTIGWRMMDNPAPTLFYMPTEKAARDISKDRLEKMLRSIPELWNAIDHRRRTVFEFFVNGVRLGLGWGGSKTQVASFASALTYFDEIDRIEDIPGEGNPYELTRVRGATYANACQVATSTPTLGKVEVRKHEKTGLLHFVPTKQKEDVPSLSFILFFEGTRHEFMLSCPLCETYFTPKSDYLVFPQEARLREVEKETSMQCPHCHGLIDQRFKHQMIQQGKMIAPGQTVVGGTVIGTPPDSRIYSAYVSGLCSPWKTWGERAANLVRAQRSGDEGRLQVILNTHFGELFQSKLQGDAPNWEVVMQLAMGSPYLMGDVPAAVQSLTCGVDVQTNRLVVVVMGWAGNRGELEGYLIQYEEIQGNTAQGEVWEKLYEKYLEGEFGEFIVREMAIDSGFNPTAAALKTSGVRNTNRNVVYDFCRTHRRALATKGSSHPQLKPFSMSLVDIDYRGRTLKKGLGLWIIDTDFFKKEVYSRIEWPAASPGRWHFPRDTPEQFFIELTAEQLTKEGKWVRTGDNHVLDCVVLNLFLVEKLKLKKVLRGSGVARSDGVKNSASATPPAKRRSVQNKVEW